MSFSQLRLRIQKSSLPFVFSAVTMTAALGFAFLHAAPASARQGGDPDLNIQNLMDRDQHGYIRMYRKDLHRFMKIAVFVDNEFIREGCIPPETEQDEKKPALEKLEDWVKDETRTAERDLPDELRKTPGAFSRMALDVSGAARQLPGQMKERYEGAPVIAFRDIYWWVNLIPVDPAQKTTMTDALLHVVEDGSELGKQLVRDSYVGPRIPPAQYCSQLWNVSAIVEAVPTLVAEEKR